MAEDHNLPGWPKKRLVKEVRRHLWHYGIRPTRFTLWQATWSWAHAIARSYWHTHWPMASEIATQYLLLLLCDMKESHMLRLPYRAGEHIPPEVVKLIPAAQQALIDGSRLLSTYRTLKNTRLWIITEAADDHGNRVCSTILLPEEY